MALTHPQENIQQFELSEGSLVADFGAGVGHYALAAAEAVGESGHIYAIEIQKKLVSKVEKKAQSAGVQNVDVIWGDLEKPQGSTLSDESVDAVIVANILFQAKNKSALLEEAYRVMKSSARLLLVDWTDAHGGLGPNEEHVLPEKTARKLAEDCGLSANKTINAGEHHYGIIFSK